MAVKSEGHVAVSTETSRYISFSEKFTKVRSISCTHYSVTHSLRERESSELVTIQLRSPIRRFWCFLLRWLDRRSANGREGALCSFHFRFSRRCKEEIWVEGEGSPRVQVRATREDFLSQPTGTFGAHRGADLKHQLPPQVLEVFH